MNDEGASNHAESWNVESRLQLTLLELEAVGGFPGWAARKILLVMYWLDYELRERKQMIGGMDNIWLLLSDFAPDFNPVCASTYTMKTKLALAAVEKVAMRQADTFPRYKQRLASMGRRLHGPYFEPDPHFNVKFHVRAARLPQPAGRRELDDLMGEFIAQKWDLTRPLWEMLLVENYHDEDGAQCALVTRGHHTLADGQGFVLSQLYMTSHHKVLSRKMNGEAHRPERRDSGRLLPSRVHPSLRFLDAWTNNRIVSSLLEIYLMLVFWVAYGVSMGVTILWSLYQAVHQITMFLLTFWRIEMLTEDYQGPRVREREFSSSKTFNIDDFKLCQRAFSGHSPGASLLHPQHGRVGHVTLNDVACAVMVDVLEEERKARRYRNTLWNNLKRASHSVLPSPIGFFIPISIRKFGDWAMRNLSTGSIVYLKPAESLAPTVSIHQLHKHIHACRSELSLLKHSLLPKFVFDLMQLTGQAPLTWPIPFALVLQLLFDPVRKFIRDWFTIPLVHLALQSFPATLTNIPGPTEKITFDDVEIVKWTAIPPQAGKGTIGMGIISYAGKICIAVAADKVPGAEGVARRICKRFEERFELYVARATEVVESVNGY